MNDETAKTRAYERLVLNHEMLCNHTFSPLLCAWRKCEYYYKTTEGTFGIPHCLKADIKNWTLYKMTKSGD